MTPWDFSKSFEILIRLTEKYSCRFILRLGYSHLCFQAQSVLILPTPLPLSSLPAFTQEIIGFFIIESHVLETTGNFRSWRNVEDLWDVVVSHLTTRIDNALESVTDPEVYLRVKENLLTFIMALEVTRMLVPNINLINSPEGIGIFYCSPPKLYFVSL